MNIRNALFFTLTVILFGILANCGLPAEHSKLKGSKFKHRHVEILLNGNKHFQAIEGFGATHLSLVYRGHHDVLGHNLRLRSIDAIYNEVGISMGNIEGALLESPGKYELRRNDNSDPFTINWGGFQTFWADAIKKEVIDLARTFAFNNYFLAQKINVRWASPWLNDIRKKDYKRYLDEAAEQIVAGQIYWRNTYGIVPKYQMPLNEPLSGNKELLNGSVQDVVDIIKSAGIRLRQEGFRDIRFVVPNEESEEKSLRVATAILADPEARKYIGAIGYHTYPFGSTYANIRNILETSGSGRPDSNRIAVRKRIRDLGERYGVPVWMTEVSHGGIDPLSFEAFRGRAIHIHDELVYAGASAYFGMNNMWDTISQQLHYGNRGIFSEEGNIVLIDTDADTIRITGMGYAIGHYARWVKKGAVRIEAASSDNLVQVTAFRNNRPKRIVIIVINNVSSDINVNIQLVGMALKGNLTGEQSFAGVYWKPLIPFSLYTPTDFVLTVPAESVTTISGRINADYRQNN